MRMKNFVMGLALTAMTGAAMAQLPKAISGAQAPQAALPVQASADTSKPVPVSDTLADNHLDKAIAAVGAGDKATSVSELQMGINNLKKEVNNNPGSINDKALAQASNLEKLLPLAQSGALQANVLQKATGMAKMALMYQRIEKLVNGAKNLSTVVGPLTSNLKGLGGAMSLLGAAGNGGQSLLTSALGGLSKLGQGGPAAAAAEPAVKGQIGSLLNFVKGSL